MDKRPAADIRRHPIEKRPTDSPRREISDLILTWPDGGFDRRRISAPLISTAEPPKSANRDRQEATALKPDRVEKETPYTNPCIHRKSLKCTRLPNRPVGGLTSARQEGRLRQIPVRFRLVRSLVFLANKYKCFLKRRHRPMQSSQRVAKGLVARPRFPRLRYNQFPPPRRRRWAHGV